jgi:hypothetical protein
LTQAELGPWILSEVEQRNLLSVFVQERRVQGKRVVVCIDNLVGFTADAWAEIERLRLIRVMDKPALELAIVGADFDAIHAPLAELVRTDDALYPHFLPSPADEDVAEYIDWRLAQFGVHNVFSGDACALINSVSQGRFSFINVLCQAVLLEQARTRAEVIDADLVDKAANALGSIKEDARAALERMPERAPVQVRAGRLVVSCQERVVRTVALHGRMLIGSSTDNDLHLPSRYVSRHHAAILQMEQGHYYIVDLNSANGVLVNGKSVSNSPLLNGDVLSLGPFRINVELNEPLRDDAIASLAMTSDTDVMPAPGFVAPLRVIKR